MRCPLRNAWVHMVVPMPGCVPGEIFVMSNLVTRLPRDFDALTKMTLRDIIDLEPRALEILAPYGFDLCCGGGHTLGKALELHQVDPGAVLPRLANLAAEDNS
jgi:hypothetical protein